MIRKEKVRFIPYTGLMSVYVKERPELLKRSLNSILKQTILPSAFVLVEDGKLNDQLDDIINLKRDEFESRGINFILLRNSRNLGLGNSLKKGLRVCPTELIARFDSDDISNSLRMEHTIREFIYNSNLAVIGSQVYEYNDDSEKPISIKKVPTTFSKIKQSARSRNPFNHMSVTFKKSIILKVGGYVDVPLFEDYYLWLRVIDSNYYVKNLNEVLVKCHVDQTFFDKRGGVNYFFKEIAFQNRILHSNLISHKRYFFNIFIRGGIRLFPRKILKVIYECIRKL